MEIGKRQLYTKGETIHKTIQKENTQNRKQKHKTNKMNIKNISRVITK
jgi:hypothetical protein